MPYILAVAAALPWLLLPVLLRKRLNDSTSLDSESAEIPVGAPLVSVIVPARNEAHNIAECVRSILGNTYPSFEIIVVDDQSTDGTSALAREAAGDDSRVRVILNDPLPSGWIGKSWACATGARHARGEILCFTDADTSHRPDALVRSVNAIARRRAELFSVYTDQRLLTRWERIVQPQIFTLICVRFGGTETVTRSSDVKDKLANGQCLFVNRIAYEQLGGHERVRGYQTEDLALAQHFFGNGKHVVLTSGTNQVSTRMYASLREIVSGWARSLYAGLRLSTPAGWAGVFFTILFFFPLVFELAPVVALLSAPFLPASSPLLLWGMVSGSGMLWWWLSQYRGVEHRILYALIYPVGSVIVLYICLKTLVRGRSVSWKGRTYMTE